jgi:SAM-dependent methyltransferase
MPEIFKPVPVSSPAKNYLLFKLRCLVDLQLATIVKYIKPEIEKIQGTCLDVGAGECPWRSWLSNSAIYTGIDIDKASDFGMLSMPDVLYYDGKVLPFNNASFDNVICVEVLEHAYDPQLLLAEISRVLKMNGNIFLTIPWSARQHHIPYDYHRFTKERLKIMLFQNNFANVEIKERGSDVSVIANKLIVLNLRLFKKKWTSWILFIPLGVLCIPISMIFLLFAHLTEVLGFGASEDPLGFYIKAAKMNKIAK